MEPGWSLLRLGDVEGAVAIAKRPEIRAKAPARRAKAVIAVPAEGFEAFYLEHHATVARALALTLGDNQLGVEATDEAMTRAFQRWDQVGSYANPAGWVYRVGLNWARSFLRKRRRTTSSPYVDDTPVHDPNPTDPQLASALAALDPKHRSVVVLRYLLDWSVDQTAEALDIAPGTVKSRLHRALTQLGAHMAPTEELS
jgi:RNA polymerase sigma-70 factor (ECF subfamily)